VLKTLSFRPINLGGRLLGQERVQPPVEIPFRVVVTDIRGNAFRDANVTTYVNGQQLYDVATDAHGSAAFPGLKGGVITVRVEAGGYVATRKVENTDETLFISLPVCAPQPFLTTTEIVILAAGGAMVATGMHWKGLDAIKMLGELGLGAAVFSAVYRHSCNG
jgi:hypothetical protein